MMLTHHQARRQRERLSRSDVARGALIGLGVALSLTLVLTFHLLPGRFEFRVGDVSTQDVRAPAKITYVSAIQTQAERERAAMAVPEQLEHDPTAAMQQHARLSRAVQAISALRAATATPLDQRVAQVQQAVEPPLPPHLARAALDLSDDRWRAVSVEALRQLDEAMRERVSSQRLTELQRELPLRLALTLPDPEEREIAVALVQRYLTANYVPNPTATERLRQQAMEAVSPVEVTVEQGEVILREGDVITPLHVEKLEALGILRRAVEWQDLVAAALLSLGVVAVVGLYLYLFHPAILGDRRVILLAVVVVTTVLAARLVITGRPLWVYLFPLPGVAMILAVLLDVPLAILTTGLLALLVGHVGGNSLETAAIGFCSSALASMLVWRAERNQAFFAAGLLVGVIELVIIAAFQLSIRGEELSGLVLLGFLALVNGTLSGALAFGTFGILGRIFGLTTSVQLLELAHPSQPLLRRLLQEAPGTYYHSLMVGNLAERAAEAIGADPLLVRVGAYYHDIGKLRRPYFFVENQAGGENPHEKLDAVTSAQVIIGHVKDGLELAQRHRLPPRLRDFIAEHHGTRVTTYFLKKAQAENAQVDTSLFHYPGPKPQSKESALLMMADATEAAIRAMKDHAPEAIESTVDRIVNQILSEGQLNECDISLEDVEAVKRAFCTSLHSVYHPRIEYPTTVQESTAHETNPRAATEPTS
ncbi:MAG TPA: HDIG domain-containing metalloprotein [Chloroflexota bacterium]